MRNIDSKPHAFLLLTRSDGPIKVYIQHLNDSGPTSERFILQARSCPLRQPLSSSYPF